jgi:hypothetical protein
MCKGLTSAAMAMAVLAALSAPASAITIPHAVLDEVLKKAAAKSGKEAMEEGFQKAARESLERIAKAHGEGALRVIEDGGLEILEATAKHGDDVIRIGGEVTPLARRTLALNADELVPLARRVGVDAVELEARAPRLSTRVFGAFGDEGGKVVATKAPAEDIPRLLKYGESADSPATKSLLLEAYNREGKSLFERIPPKLVLASGLTASMIYGTYRGTEPLHELGQAIKNSPDTASEAVRYLVIGSLAAGTLIICLLLWRFGFMPWQRPIARPQKPPLPAKGSQGKKLAVSDKTP